MNAAIFFAITLILSLNFAESGFFSRNKPNTSTTSTTTEKTQNSNKADPSDAATNTTSAPENEVEKQVVELGGGNFQAGVEKVLDQFNSLTSTQIGQIDKTLEDLGLQNANFLISPILDAISKATGIQVDKSDAAKNLLTIALNANNDFMANSTRMLLSTVTEVGNVANAIKSSQSDPNALVAVTMLAIDKTYSIFQNHSLNMALSLDKLNKANSFNLPEVSIQTVTTLAKENNELMSEYAQILKDLSTSIVAANNGKYDGPAPKELVDNLQSVKNRDKIGKQVDNILEDIEANIDNTPYQTKDLLEALKNKKLLSLTKIMKNLGLQAGLAYVKGVNDVGKTDALENIAKTVGTADPKLLQNSLANLIQHVGNSWKLILLDLLQTQMTAIQNPSVETLSDATSGYLRNSGKGLTILIRNVENDVNSAISGNGAETQSTGPDKKPQKITLSTTTKKPDPCMCIEL